jgi:splicing suppressor protein 51
MASRLSQSRTLLRLSSPSSSPFSYPSRRSFFGFNKKKSAVDSAPPPLLSQDDLFHPLSASPFPEMRAKSQRIQSLAFCPVSMDKYGEKVHVAFECLECGYPTHASEERWNEDTEKGRYWPRLREANEDEHDLRSGREMSEFNLPGNESLSMNQRQRGR